MSDVERIKTEVVKWLHPIESQVYIPDSESEFGYCGHHFVMFLPSEVFSREITPNMAPRFFELQIKTLFQHAWAEGNHDLCYKPEAPLTVEQKRLVYFTAAQAWGADQVFNGLYADLTAQGPNAANHEGQRCHQIMPDA